MGTNGEMETSFSPLVMGSHVEMGTFFSAKEMEIGVAMVMETSIEEKGTCAEEKGISFGHELVNAAAAEREIFDVEVMEIPVACEVIYADQEREIYEVNVTLTSALNKVTSVSKKTEGSMVNACGREKWNVSAENGTAFQETQIVFAVEAT
ncbi:hypothetical protein AAC387_Pa07g3816 [Persea americana]